MNDQFEPCPFCGQSVLVTGETKEKRQYEAKDNCGCAAARKWQEEERRIELARAELLEVLMTDLIEQDEQPTAELTDQLCNMLPLMVRDGVDQITVLADGIGKLTITYNGSWKIKKQRGISVERKV